MTERVLDIAESASKISVRNRLLVVARPEVADVTIPLEEVAVVVASHPQVVFTQAALAEVALKGGMVVVCGSNHHPAGMLMPLTGHHLQAERFAQQASAAKPVGKRVWQQVVRAKILHQAMVLERVGTEEPHHEEREVHEGEKTEAEIIRDLRGEELYGLAGMTTGEAPGVREERDCFAPLAMTIRAMAERVHSGDPDNVEAQAARKYWPLLFGPDFHRDREAAGVNPMLNYGYAILRAMTARAVCAAGLHPTLGLHHHNKYNAFCLADGVRCVDADGGVAGGGVRRGTEGVGAAGLLVGTYFLSWKRKKVGKERTDWEVKSFLGKIRKQAKKEQIGGSRPDLLRCIHGRAAHATIYGAARRRGEGRRT